ncbi:hypothetical protein BCR32DRAFT_285275 [Anaeromyces robustus]|uniref:G-protein coupled receptors family 3 profile domain-containing protein n=1 Tax=Anaeromyces robustus TaxID=1754192 RepID=A0A1Y1WP94_9FUNG|nr:hypothetical protein BCR32DRAFT_285275 [Anaeromyces robustus]|eukprot:ORX75340.1 hypothetical protein BCR32DRAFT_285275 [Anaeromyces robustus]
MNLLHFGIFIIIINSIIINVNSNVISIKNENDLINSFKSDNSIDTLVIKVNRNIEILQDIEIKDCNYNKVSISGNSVDTSILDFRNNYLGFIFNNKNITEISINKVTIKGNLFFKNYDYKITISNSVIKGGIDLYNSNSTNNSSITFNKVEYYGGTNNKDNCMNLYGNVNITNSHFYGSSSCKDSILSYYGENINSIEVNNSSFDGVYSNNCISIIYSNESNIKSSTFERGAAFVEGGGAIRATESYISVNECTFQDNYTPHNGGVFYIFNCYSFEANNIEVYNAKAINKGSLLYMYSTSNFKTYGSITNSMQTDDGVDERNILGGGVIASVEGYSNLYVESFTGENLDSGYGIGAFTLNYASTIELMEITLTNISGSNVGGVLFTSENEESGSSFKVNGGTFTDFHQKSSRESSSLIRSSKNIEIVLENCEITEIYTKKGNFIYTMAPSTVELNNVYLEGHYSNDLVNLIQCDALNNSDICKLTLSDVTISTFESMNGIIVVYNGDISITNSYFTYSYTCLYSELCDYQLYSDDKSDGFIAYLGTGTNMTIESTTIESILGNIGFKAEKQTNINIIDSTVTYCSFYYSFIMIDTSSEYKYGHYLIENTVFDTNGGDCGSIINIEEIDENSSIIFNDSTFHANYASYGGVIYTASKLTPKYVSFNNCEFSNYKNTANEGFISYSLSKEYEPKISNIDELREGEKTFSTNPVGIKFMDDSIQTFSILSGERIPEGIKCEFIDDYGNIPIFKYESIDQKVSSISNYVFFNLEVEDKDNLAIIGKPISYCVLSGCSFPLIKIIGNPGTHKLKFQVDSYGPFKKFDNDSFEIEFTIEKCDESKFAYRDIENVGLKSCFSPQCLQNCNSGRCISNNVCNCTNTNRKGQFCNEYYKLERNIPIDYTIRITAFVLMGISLIIMITIVYYRQNNILKSGSIDFLVLILIGVLVNCFYIVTLTIGNKTKDLCIISYLTTNLGFTLVFGSITVKTYRIYRIGIKRRTMYLLVLIIGVVHALLLISWIITDTIKTEVDYTNDKKEFHRCYYPETKIFSILFNLIILYLGWHLTYACRNFRKEFNEQLNAPIYAYVLTMVFIEIISLEKGINIVVQDLFIAIGTIIHTIFVIHFIYIKKFYYIIFGMDVDFNSIMVTTNTKSSNPMLSNKNMIIKSRPDGKVTSTFGSQFATKSEMRNSTFSSQFLDRSESQSPLNSPQLDRIDVPKSSISIASPTTPTEKPNNNNN